MILLDWLICYSIDRIRDRTGFRGRTPLDRLATHIGLIASDLG